MCCDKCKDKSKCLKCKKLNNEQIRKPYIIIPEWQDKTINEILEEKKRYDLF